jgi:hypothetical protein
MFKRIVLLPFLLAACEAVDPEISAESHPVRFGHPGLYSTRPVPDFGRQLATRLRDCPQAGVPMLTSVVATYEDPSTVGLVIEGRSCGATISDFGFRIYDADGRDITGRSWPEVESVEVAADGRFTLHGLAWSCGDLSNGQSLVVEVHGASAAADVQ